MENTISTMAEAWNYLGIDKTKDKRSIRKAYAVRSKLIHPEEKPEEFQLLYEAYQMALRYAENKQMTTAESELGNVSEEQQNQDDFPSEQNKTESSEIFLAFDKAEHEIEELRSFCICTWDELLRDKELCFNKWRRFFSSDAFKKMKMDSVVLNHICDDLEGKKQVWEACQRKLWELYELDEWEENNPPGEMRRLYHALYPAWKRENQINNLKKMRIQKEEEEDRERQERKNVILISLLVFLIFMIIWVWVFDPTL